MGKTFRLKDDIRISTGSIRTSNEAGYSMDATGNFKHTRNTATDFWHLDNNSGSVMLKYYWETGALKLNGRDVISETELFNGDSNDVTLSDNVSNYTYLEIWYRSNDGSNHQGYTKVYAPQGKQIVLTYNFYLGYLYTKQSSFYIWNDTITQQWGVEWYFGSGGTPTLNTASNINITRVVGCK